MCLKFVGKTLVSKLYLSWELGDYSGSIYRTGMLRGMAQGMTVTHTHETRVL